MNSFLVFVRARDARFALAPTTPRSRRRLRPRVRARRPSRVRRPLARVAPTTTRTATPSACPIF